MNPTQTAKLSVIFISLIYFLPLLNAGTILANLQPNGTSPFIIYLLCTVALLLLILPAAGIHLYAATIKPGKKSIHLGMISLVIAALLIFFMPMFGVGPSGIFAGIFAILYIFIYPFLLFFYIPAWFTIPGLRTPCRIPQILAFLAPIVQILSYVFLFSLGRNADENIIAISLVFISVTVTTLAGILLLYRGFTYPEEQ